MFTSAAHLHLRKVARIEHVCGPERVGARLRHRVAALLAHARRLRNILVEERVSAHQGVGAQAGRQTRKQTRVGSRTRAPLRLQVEWSARAAYGSETKGRANAQDAVRRRRSVSWGRHCPRRARARDRALLLRTMHGVRLQRKIEALRRVQGQHATLRG